MAFYLFSFFIILILHLVKGSMAVSGLPSVLIKYKDITLNESEDKVYKKALFKDAPKVTFDEADPNTSYTLIMEDPDAPTHKDGEAWLHWIIANIPGGDLAQGDVSKGVLVTKHNPPTPPSGTGVHRYYFYIYSEDKPKSKTPPQSYDNRKKFKIADYVSERQLKGPVASNMFKTEF